MKIKDRLALYFTALSTLILLFVLFGVYFTFKIFMRQEFFLRLTDRTMVTAKLYLEADEISAKSLDKVRTQYMIKLNGEVTRIYDSRNAATFIGDDQQYWTSGTIDKVRKNKKLEYIDGDRQVVGIYYKDNQGDFVVLASAIDYGTITRLDRLWKIMAAAFVIIFMTLLLTARWMAKRVLSPLSSFINEISQVNTDKLDLRLKEGKSRDEIYQLAQNFNQLMDHLEQAFVLQKTFVANASHELRTPVTRLIMTAELALQQERSKSEYQDSLQGILEDSNQLEHIISSLLLLAQSDLGYGASSVVPVRIDELMWKLQKEWMSTKGNFHVDIAEFPEDEQLLVIKCNPTLLQIALDNIINNAYKFSKDQPVTCTLRISEQEISIGISDLGIGIKPSEIESIFKAFYSGTADGISSGNGMGLYMASKIIHLYHGTIEVSSSEGIGTTFSLQFKRL
jgi:signal transduction histidine kinase